MSIVETLDLPHGQRPDGDGWTKEAASTAAVRWMRPLHFTVAQRRPEWFTSSSGRTVASMDRAGMQRLAEEHEWMRDRIVQLETENARMSDRHAPMPVECFEAATAG